MKKQTPGVTTASHLWPIYEISLFFLSMHYTWFKFAMYVLIFAIFEIKDLYLVDMKASELIYHIEQKILEKLQEAREPLVLTKEMEV